jgi:hypothetical protein
MKMNIKEIRRYNLIALIAQKIEDKTFEFQEDFAEGVGIDPSYLSMMIMPSDRKGARGVSEKKARLIEEKLGLPELYLDAIQNLDGANVSDEIKQAVFKYPSSIYIPFLDENSIPTEDEPKKLGMLFPASQLDQLGLSIKGENCAVWAMKNDCMSPKINVDDTVLIDQRVQSFDDLVSGKIYAYRVNNEVRVNRIFKEIMGGLRITSENSLKTVYPDELVRDDQTHLIELCGLIVWRGGSMY